MIKSIDEIMQMHQELAGKIIQHNEKDKDAKGGAEAVDNPDNTGDHNVALILNGLM